MTTPVVRAKRGSRPQIHVFEADRKTLLVPNRSMWLIHELSKPTALLTRLGLSHEEARNTWRSWMRSYGERHADFKEWLYSHPAPMPRAWDGESLGRSPLIPRFRKAATAKSLCASARDAGEHVSPSLICYWLKRLRDVPGYRPWQLRGEESPTEVIVVTEQQLVYFGALWDYTAHYRQAQRLLRKARRREAGWEADAGDDTPAGQVSYVHWLGTGHLMPDMRFLRWLYGDGAPGEFFVVREPLQKLRARSSNKGICRAAGVAEGSIDKWRRMFPDAFQAVEGAGRAMTAEQRAQTVAYAKAATLEARCQRAGLSVHAYSGYLQRAQRFGGKHCKEDLLRYLRSEGEWRAYGIIPGTKLYLPSPLLLRFRESVMEVRTMKRYGIMASIPAPLFGRWFRACVIPPPTNRAEPIEIPEAIAVDVEHQRQPEIESPRQRLEHEPQSESLTAVEMAIPIYLRDPNQTLRAVAKQVGCNHSLLSRDERFRRLLEAHRATLPRGTKSKEGELEAEEPE